jgi:predicted DNA-binding protein
MQVTALRGNQPAASWQLQYNASNAVQAEGLEMLSVRLPAELEARLTAHCKREGISKTRVVARALERELAQAAPVDSYELLQRHLKGARGEPRDLSERVSDEVKAKLRRKYARAQRTR